MSDEYCSAEFQLIRQIGKSLIAVEQAGIVGSARGLVKHHDFENTLHVGAGAVVSRYLVVCGKRAALG